MQLVDEYIEPFVGANEFVTRMGHAESVLKVLEIVRSYLRTWTQTQIASVQAEAQGCAPFDQFGWPSPIYAPRDVIVVSHALEERCEVLRASGVAPSSHLVELSRFFLVTNAILIEMMTLSVARHD